MEKTKKELETLPQKEIVTSPGEELGAHMDPWWGLVIGAVLLLIVLIVAVPNPYGRIFRFVSDGISITIVTTIVAFVLMIFLGLLGGLGRSSKNKLVYGVASLYVEIVRGIPLLVQLIFWYYAFPALVQEAGHKFNIAFLSEFQAAALPMAIFGLTICYGAYMSEIFRAGI